MRNFTFALKAFILFFLLGTTAFAHAGITADSLHTTASTCADNGTITVFAHTTGGTLYYATVSGPAIRTRQSSSQFLNLPSGVYQLLITDAANDSLRITDTVKGNYTSPNFTPASKAPACPGTATGIIVGNPQNAGTKPFSWTLTNLSTSQTTTQASDSFFNLAAGSYSLRQYDSCGNFATYNITLTAPNDSFAISGIVNRIFNCDSVSMYITLHVISGTYAAPYTIKVQTRNGTYQHTITNIVLVGSYPYLYESVGGVSYGDSIGVTITDACGRSVYAPNTVSKFNFGVNYTSVTDSCHVKYIADFYLTGDTTQRNVNTAYMPDPVTVTVYTTGGVFLDSTVTNDPINHFSQYAYTAALVSGQSYRVKITDGCGHSVTNTYQWPNAPAPTVSTSVIALSCLDSTACIEVLWQNTFYSVPTFHLLSGPGSIGSTKAHYIYHDSIVYPQTYNANGNSTNGYFMQLTNLAAGTYHYSISDSCGNTLTDSFTVTKQNLNSDHFNASYIRGCPGQNAVTVAIDNFSSGTLTEPGTTVALNNHFDTVNNLSSGTYVVTLQYTQTTYSIPVNQHPACQIIIDTVVVPPYQSPQIISATQIKCHGTEYVVLLPDSTKGVAPYKYELISGPQTTGLQSSNIFALTLQGTYTARVTDSCGFAGTFTFTLDTTSFGTVTNNGGSCVGNTAVISCQYSPYATYVWHLPSGSTYTGYSLVINPVTLANYGTYTISKIISISGCHDTLHSSYVLYGTGTSAIAASICQGQGYLFGGISRIQAGTYYDTIPGSPCDSIVTLTLTIRSNAYDSVSQTICQGQSVTVGTHTYTATGVYRDTFATAGCDSIYVLHLTVNGYKHGAISQTICQGQSYLFGGAALTQTGTYYDTIPTAGCDSIITLTLTSLRNAYDSVTQSICQGQSVTVGTHTYTNTGIYRDTFATAGCDSIHVLNLTVGSYRRSSFTQSICQGQSYTFGSQTLTQAGNYYDTIPTAGCDSIVTLTLNITAPAYDSVALSICTGQTVTVGTHTYSATGIYRDTFATANCDSIHVLNLTVNNYKIGFTLQAICQGQSYQFGSSTLTRPGLYYDTIPTTGCDSIAVLTLTVNTPAYDSTAQSICTGQSVTVGTHTYTTTGIYRDTFATANCDSVHVLNLQVNSYKYGSVSAVLCPGQNYLFGNQTITQSGLYYDTIPTAGCDSIVTLTLTAGTSAYDSILQTICAGQSVTVGTHTYTATGVYRDTFTTTGCDSIHILNLTVNGYGHGTVSQTICQGQNYIFGNQTLTQAGTYFDTIPTAGCDSIVALTLTVTAPSYDSVARGICTGQSITVGTHTYTATGIYRDTFATANCDSIHILNLTVSNYTHGAITRSICSGGSFAFGNTQLTQAGTYYDTIPTTGCDSIVTLILTINPPALVTDTADICAGQSVTVGTHIYTQSGTYIDTLVTNGGCLTIHTLLLTVSPNVAQALTITVSHGPVISGLQTDTFRAAYSGCSNPYFSWFQDIVPLGIHTQVAVVSYPAGQGDSILCRMNCPDGCPKGIVTYSNSIYTGINDPISFIQSVNIYPNPTQGNFSIEMNIASGINKEAQLSVIDIMGQPVYTRPVTLLPGYNNQQVLLNAAPGVYIVQLMVGGQSLFYRLVLNGQH